MEARKSSINSCARGAADLVDAGQYEVHPRPQLLEDPFHLGEGEPRFDHGELEQQHLELVHVEGAARRHGAVLEPVRPRRRNRA